ncbi:transcriptional regulator GlxA family with amidase domain [Trinickia symbiotica]|uniref:AraC family transcriptional regulator n=1 Tax=Trinickia symbiotica TaxID=863227 RepID=A0A2N7X6E5_9BURK|nr:AraC family transcriptional regulator [Trinickia symbiotica]PPK43018.1 transcriptional regulator GlxA family with amidase domain [Trinickia symbiotica]
MAYIDVENIRADGSKPLTPDPATHSRRIGLLLLKDFSFLALAMVTEVFQMANEVACTEMGKSRSYDLRLLSLDGGDIACASSAKACTDRLDPREVGELHAAFIMGKEGEGNAARDRRLIKLVRLLYPNTAPMDPFGARIELGAASARRPRTSGWGQRISMERHVKQGHSSVNDDPYRAMCAALVQVKRDWGLDVAVAVAERLSPGFGSELAPLLSQVSGKTVGDKVRASARWLLAHCEHPVTIADAAEIAAMSERNFLRCFKREMSVTPSEFLLQTRLDLTCHLLAKTNLPVDNIARCTGMRNGDRLAKMFRKRFAASPTEYRLRTQPRDDDATSPTRPRPPGYEQRTLQGTPAAMECEE